LNRDYQRTADSLNRELTVFLFGGKMKKLLTLTLLTVLAAPLCAEPLLLEQADKVLQPGTLEAGLGDMIYQNDTVKLTDAAGTVVKDYAVTATVIPVTARLALNEKFEASLAVPYNTVTSNFSGASVSESAMADASLGIKYVLSDGEAKKTGLILRMSLPTGDKKFRQGMDIQPVLSFRKIGGKRTWNLNIAYDMTAEYEDANSIKNNPGDVLSAGLGFEKARNEKLTWISELVFRSISSASNAGVTTTDSAGTQMDWSLGARINSGDWKKKLGLVIAFGDETYRTYDYRVLAGVTYLFKI
jgi:hypothetical protein